MAVLKMASCELMPSPKTFWPSIKDDLTKVTWAHAVNSKDDFNKALKALRLFSPDSELRYTHAQRKMAQDGIWKIGLAFNRKNIAQHRKA
uniref:(California timema) hypothetical protein n=1 Tax=Timema californicum TaxID=61474 RepID=A0A7R9PCY3_TIMCA|nr:unnamed protein product [Timema californicum]